MLLFVFIDGVGMGPDMPSNPLASDDYQALSTLAEGRWVEGTQVDRPDHIFRSIDAGLGVEGLPQSATGQTTLFTGVNGSQVEGMHISAFPTMALREVIATNSLLKQANEAGYRATFANAFSPGYWEYTTSKTNRHSATTLTNMAAGLPFRDLDDLDRGHAVYWDITHEVARANYAPEMPYVSPQEAGSRLSALMDSFDLVLYETFLPDLTGHRRLPWSPQDVLLRIDGFLGGILSSLPEAATLLITSDHGNLEDPTTKGHTYNPVPLLVIGAGASYFDDVHDLTGITPSILNYLKCDIA